MSHRPTGLRLPGEVIEHRKVRSAFNQEPAAELPFGIMAARGIAERGVVLLKTSVDFLAGVTAFDPEHVLNADVGDDGIKPGGSVGLLTHGIVLVRVEEAVRVGDPVHARATGSGLLGQFRATAIPAATIDLSRIARWVSPGPAGGVAELDMDMTNLRQATNGCYLLLVDNAGNMAINTDEEPIYAAG
jgi:hypothetical protein